MLPRFMLQWRRIATPIALGMVSLAVALALWIAVTEAENPNTITVFSGSIEVEAVNVPDGLAVASIRDPVVSVRISAPESTVRRLTAADFRAEVDLSGVRQTTSDQRVISRVAGNRDVEIVDVTPAIVTVVLEPLASKNVPVQSTLVGSPPQGYSIDQSQVEASPPQVRVTGAESLVRLVSYASAEINLTGLRVSLRQQYQLVPKDVRGAEVRGVRIDPATAEIRLPLSQQEITLAVTIVPSVQGIVADGYNLVGVTADPPAIAVSGPLEVLQALPWVTTEPVDLTGLRVDATRTVRLRLPAGIQSTRDSVAVRVRVAPAQGEITLAVTPQLTNVPEGLRPFLQSPIVTVRLSGELPTLRALTSSSVRATVSLAGLPEGVHVLRPAITAPESVQVLSFDPPQVTVSLQR